MSQEIIENNPPQVAPVFQRGVTVGQGGNVGAIAIEQERAIAEAQGQLVLAKRFPRDLNIANIELMQSCRIDALAKVAFYSVPRGGGKVSGPSIRLAEEIARCYGNFEYGHRELSRSEGKSEVEVFAWDKEKNNRSVRQITVMHTLDTKDGQRPLRDQKDVDDKIANVASKQVRGRILALMPKWMVEGAIEECKKTLAGKNEEPLEQRVRKMVDAFGKFGVKVDQIVAYIGKAIDHADADDFVELLGVYNAIRDGAKVADYFQTAAPAMADAATPTAATLDPAAKGTTSRRAGGKKPDQPAAEVPPAGNTNPNKVVDKLESERPATQTEESKPAPAIVDAPKTEPPTPNPEAGASVNNDDNPFNFED